MNAITWRQLQIFSVVGILISAYFLGYSWGRHSGREAALQGAVASFRQREKINNEISELGSVDLCIALGGLSDECSALVRGLDETPESKPSGNDGK